MIKHIPNTITCCNLVCGCIAIVHAVFGEADMALLFIILGAVFDFFDGMSARLLGVSSPIGKELDSLADVVTFGVAPSAMVFDYLFQNIDADQSFYFACVAFAMAAFSALRLAKFNLDERQTTSFIGLPTPANALFWGALMVAGGQWLSSSPSYIYGVVALLFVSCYLLVAELPMFALKFKHWGWKGNEGRYIFLLTSAALILTLGIIGISAAIVWYVVLSLTTSRKTC